MKNEECKVDGCKKTPRSKGLCMSHYQQKRRGKTKLTPLRKYTRKSQAS